MISFMGKFELYLDKLKKIDVSRVFTEDISFPEFLYLKFIDYHSSKDSDKSVQVSKLVEDSGVTAQAVSKFLRGLEGKGCILRYSNKDDRRITQVKLTERGKQIYEVTQKEITRVMGEVFCNFTREEIENLDFLISKFLVLYEETIDKMRIGG